MKDKNCRISLGQRIDHFRGCPFGRIDDLSITVLPLQHEGLNRGPWKELEGFERNLAKIFPNVYVIIDVVFDGDSEVLPTGAVIPTGFKKTILFDNKCFYFYFPNEDVSGIDWINFRINQ